jgi:hypothetical protein
MWQRPSSAIERGRGGGQGGDQEGKSIACERGCPILNPRRRTALCEKEEGVTRSSNTHVLEGPMS